MLLTILVVVLGLVVAIEVGLRLLFGFGNPLVYLADSRIGYLLAPDQNVKRFGNRIEINQYSMRSAAVTPERSPDTLRIFLLGDSVANGGWWTDQSETISVLLESQLSTPGEPPSRVEVLNASANSWGPRNELAYLERFGTFQSQVIVLLINTDDLFATAPQSWVVGRDRNYPDRKPPMALVEVLERYLFPNPPMPEEISKEPGDRVGFNLQAIEQIQTIAQQQDSRFLLVLTPLLRETGKPGPRDYEAKARQRLQDLVTSQGIGYIDLLPAFQTAKQPEALYRDHIHLSPMGNQEVSRAIDRWIKTTLAPTQR